MTPIVIKDHPPLERAVQMTANPDDMNLTNVQGMAEKAWLSVNKEVTDGKVTVRVRDV